jgi:pre-mRNA cleavage complex 2 protein Pcf11
MLLIYSFRHQSFIPFTQDWMHDVSVGVKSKGRTDGHRPLNAKAAAAAEIAKRDVELRAFFVVVPPGDEAKPVSCPICKEIIKSEFLEDDEDWVWKNAIKKEDRVCLYSVHLFSPSLIVSSTDIPCNMSC